MKLSLTKEFYDLTDFKGLAEEVKEDISKIFQELAKF